jgi:Ca2+-binding EF-hand superfamily protein
MPAPVVTQLIIDASGARQGVAEFEASMAKAKAAAVDGGAATAQSFESAQRRWVQSLGATDPVIRAQIRMKDDLAKQEAINTRAVQLGIATSDAAKSQMDAVRQKHEGMIQTIREQTGQLAGNEKAWLGLKNATSGVSGQLIALSAGAGPVGVFLSALGPWGIAAAVGIGAISAAINHMISEANRMGEGAIAMRTFSETTGLSITQLKTLGRAGAEFGIGTDIISASIEKFTVNMEEARKGQGKLYDEVRKIDGGLADELAAATTTAKAWDVLAKARAAASDQSKNALSKAAFNKGGLETGLVLDVTAEAGGLDVLVAKQQKLNGMTDEQIKKWGLTKVQIDETQKRTANMMAAVYSQEVLDRQLQAAQLEERITRALVDANAQRQKQRSYLDLFSAGVDTNPKTPMETAKENLKAGLSAGQKLDTSGYDDLAKKLWAVVDAEKAEADARKLQADAATRSANKDRERIGYLGSAATIEERRLLRMKELDAAVKSNFATQTTYDRAVQALDLDTLAAKQSAYVAALGASAPIAQIVLDKELQLQKQRLQDPRITKDIIESQKLLIASQQLGTYQIQSQIDVEKTKQDTIVMSAGAAAAYTAEQTRLNKARQDGQILAPKELKDLRDKSVALGVATQASAQAAAQSKADFDLQTMFLSDTEKSIAQVQFQLRGNAWQSFMNDGLSASLRLVGSFKDLQSYTTGFTTDLAHGLTQGKSLVDSLSAAAVNLGQKLIDAGLNSAINIGLNAITGASGAGGALGGAAGGAALTAGAATAGATLIASATAAAGILAGAGVGAGTSVSLGAADASLLLDFSAADAAATLGIGGATAGTALDLSAAAAGVSLSAGGAAAGLAIWGPIAAIAAILIGIGLMSAGGEDKVKKAQEEWKKAGPAFQKFLTEMSGGVQGNLSQQIQDASAREADFEDRAWRARDVAAINAARSGLQRFSDNQKRLFLSTVSATVEGLNDGLGLDSPFMKAVGNIKTALNSQLAFIDDANTALGDQSYDGVTLEKARSASQAYMVSLLQQPPALSAVQTGLAQIHGTANALQGALMQLGLSSTDAARAISNGVSKAIANLKKQFEEGLTERLNTANGKSYLNDATKLLAQHQQDLTDAASLGVDPARVATLFRAEAQKIINDAGLVGGAFTDFITQFPQLADIVTQATKDIAGGISDFKAGLTSRLNIAHGSSFLNDAASLLKQHQQDLADAARFGNDPALMTQIATLFAAEAQKIVNGAGLVGDAFSSFKTQFPDLAGVVVEATDSIAASQKQLQDGINSTAKTLVDYVASITTGPNSTSSPQDRFNAAQAVYSAKLVLAQGGNIDAQNTISQDAENYRQAARDRFGSAMGYQSVLQQIKAQLLALPAVQQTTDPVVQAMRDVLLAIQATTTAVTGTTSAITAMQGALIGGLASNSPAAIAGAFLQGGIGVGGLTAAQFSSIFGIGLTFDQFKNGFPPGLASDATLHDLFDVIDANKDGIITQLELLQAALKPAIDSGNASAIASALSNYFNAIDTNTSQTIDLSEMQTALAGMASNSALVSMFTRLDADNSGSISRLELIKAASQSTTNTVATVSDTISTVSDQIHSTIVLQDAANSLTTTANNIANAQWVLLDAIRALQTTANSQFNLLNAALNPTINPVTLFFTKTGAGTSDPQSEHTAVNEQALTVLEKININTWATAGNTRALIVGAANVSARDGLFAAGGWVTGGTPGVDSVRILAQQKEFIVNPYATSALTRDYGPGVMDLINSGRLPSNDNFRASNVVDFSAASRFPATAPVDNGQHFVTLAQTLARTMVEVSLTEMASAKEESAALRLQVAALTAELRSKPAPERPNARRTGTNR